MFVTSGVFFEGKVLNSFLLTVTKTYREQIRL